MPEDSKTCTKCHETKTLSEYHRNSHSRDGRHNQCRTCRTAYARSRDVPTPPADATKTCNTCQETKSLDEFYASRNGRLGRHAKCVPCYLESSRGWYHSDLDASRARKRESQSRYRRRNPDKVRDDMRDYYQRNTERYGAYNHARRDRLKGAPTDVSVTLTAVCEWFGYVCHLCGNTIPQNASERRLQPTMDHLVPVSSPDYPNHGTTWDNVRPAHSVCNTARRDKPLDAWFAYIERARSRAPWFTD